MYAQAGAAHPGYDCFVFPRAVIPELEVGKVCLGANRVGLVFVLALHVACGPVTLIADAHLTFHLGDDRRWQDPRLQDYASYNDQQARTVIDRLEARHGPFDSTLPSWSYQAVLKLKAST
jgi:hypothetical protein